MNEQKVLAAAYKLRAALQEEFDLRIAVDKARSRYLELDKRQRHMWEETMVQEGNLKRAVAGDIIDQLMGIYTTEMTQTEEKKEEGKKPEDPWDFTIV